MHIVRVRVRVRVRARVRARVRHRWFELGVLKIKKLFYQF